MLDHKSSLLRYTFALGILILVSCENQPPTQSTAHEEVDNSKEIKVIAETEGPIAEEIDLSADIPQFVVVAGAYSSSEGALTKVLKLRELGFVNADTIQRPGSKLYSALVERFDSRESAEAFASDLATNKKIKSYVYRVK